MTEETKIAQVSTTLPSREAAEAMAEAVIDSGLAACAQVSGPVASHFVWKGERCREEEWLCVMKTPASCAVPLMELIRGAHPYETPEIIVTAVTDALPAYLAWVLENTRGPERV